MDGRRAGHGYLVATLGGAGLIASLWLPWYSFRIPAQAVSYAAQMAQQFGVSPSVVREGAAYLNQLGPLHFSAWHALSTIPAILLVCGVVGGGLAALSLAGRAAGVARVAGLAGLVAGVLAGYRIIVPPGPGELVHPAWGVYLGLASAILMAVGGLLAGSENEPAHTEPALDLSPSAPGATTWSTAHSAPPPTH